MRKRELRRFAKAGIAAKRQTQAPRQNAKPNNRGKTGGWGDLALRGNAGKAQQAQAKRGWGGAADRDGTAAE